jgi:hypothetical protein
VSAGKIKTKAELIKALRHIAELARVEPLCKPGMEWQAIGGISYLAEDALGIYKPRPFESSATASAHPTVQRRGSAATHDGLTSPASGPDETSLQGIS